MQYAGVVFDLDGTLTRPGAIDFDAIRRRIGMRELGSILHWIADNASSDEEVRAMEAVVHEEEANALARMELGDGIGRLLDTLLALRDTTRVGICTRNSHDALDAFRALLVREGHPSGPELFDVQLARDSHSETLGRPVRNKPSPEPAHEIQRRWGLVDRFPPHEGDERDPPVHRELLFVGDSVDDLVCGRRAGFRAGWIGHGTGTGHELAHVAFDTLACVAAELTRPD